MPAISTLTLVDAKPTPVTHTLSPASVSPLVWRDAIANKPLIEQISITASQKMDMGNGLNKTKFTVKIPTLAVLSGGSSNGYAAAPRVAYSHTINCEVICPSAGTEQERKDIIQLAAYVLEAGIIKEAVIKAEAIY